MPDDHRIIHITSEITLSALIERARRDGEVRLVDGRDSFILKHLDDKMPDAAREFLTRGGPVGDEY